MSRFVDTVANLDRALFRAVFGLKWRPLTAVMRWFTVVGSAGFLWGVVAAAAFLLTWAFYGFEPRGLLVPWLSVALSWVVAEGVKFLFNRSRPFIRDAGIAPLIKTPSSSSFPSGHSATAAAGAITLSALYPMFAPALVVAAFFVMLSRVYLGVHYPFDVLAGATIGVVVSATILAIL